MTLDWSLLKFSLKWNRYYHDKDKQKALKSVKDEFRAIYNRRPVMFCWLKKEKIKFSSPPSPPCNVVPLFELPEENNKHPNFEWRVGEGGKGVDGSVLRSYPANALTILSPIVWVANMTIQPKENWLNSFLSAGMSNVWWLFIRHNWAHHADFLTISAISLFSVHDLSCHV